MGFFDKLFGKGKSSDNNQNLSRTAELLEEGLYWKIIASAVKKSPDQEEQEQILVSQINKLSPNEIVGFKLRTDKFLDDIYTSEMWCAAYIINGGCSDDGFEYFRCWVISRGKDVYYNAKTNPDSLVKELNEEIEEYEFESFLSVASDTFTDKTGEEIDKFIDDENVGFTREQKVIDFNWEEEKPATLKAICPNLFAAKWN